MITTKTGERITYAEAYERFKIGMTKVTPLQMAEISNWGYYLVIGGIIFGVISTLITKAWWMAVILIGSLVLTAVGFLGNWQKVKALKTQDDMIKQLESQINQTQEVINEK